MDETAISTLFIEMLRAGAIDPDIVESAAEECEAGGHDMSAHRLRCLIVEAQCTPATERAKQARRASFRTIDGGNSD